MSGRRFAALSVSFVSIALLAPSFGLAACDGGGGGSPAHCTDEQRAPSEYPTTPYGKAVGETLEDLIFLTPEGETISLAEVRARAGAQLLLLSTSAGWCVACAHEMPELEEMYETWGPEGLEVLVTVFEDALFEPATPDDAGQWRTRHELSFDVVADPDAQFAEYYDSRLTPMNMLVDLCTMEIISLETGFDRDALEQVIDERL